MAFRYESLVVWPLALEYVDACFVVADGLPQQVQFSIGEQLRRAATSVVANIAEGSGKATHRSERNFYDIARGSLAETVGLLALCRRRGYLDADRHERMYNRANLISSMLWGLIKANMGPRRDREGAQSRGDARSRLSEEPGTYDLSNHDPSAILVSPAPSDPASSPSPETASRPSSDPASSSPPPLLPFSPSSDPASPLSPALASPPSSDPASPPSPDPASSSPPPLLPFSPSSDPASPSPPPLLASPSPSDPASSPPPLLASPSPSDPASSPPRLLASSPPPLLASSPEPGTVYFVGAGPGAPDLITVRGRAIIAQADLVLYADSLVQESVAHLARKPDARLVGSSDLHLEQLVSLMVEAAQAGGVVARVHTGDPALYGATYEQMAALAAQGVPYAVVPGVTAAFAAAARLGVELTLPEQVQTLILSRAAGRTPVPEREGLQQLATHGASLALYLSIGQIERVVADLLAGGAYTPQTPAAVAYKVTWPDEQIITGTLADIADKVRAAGYTRHALILVSPALRQPDAAPRSRLYDQSFAHACRAAAPPTPEQAAPHPAIIAVTRNGSALAERLAHDLAGVAVVPTRFADGAAAGYTGPVAAEIRRRWRGHRQLLLIMSTGVALRALAPLLRHKAEDPAVVCLDETGRSVIPLLGGHQAGANGLAQRVAALTGGHVAITTASDVQAIPALDLLGSAAGWRIDPASALTNASACLVNGDPVGLFVDPALPAHRAQAVEWLATAANVVEVAHLDDLRADAWGAGLLVTHQRLDGQERDLLQKSVCYHPPVLVVGVGSRRDVAAEEVNAAIMTTLQEAGLAVASLAALATADLKADEAGIQQAAADFGVPLRIIPRAQLAALAPDGFSHSAAQDAFGLPGVAEPCAVVVAGGDQGALLVPKRSFAHCTVAVALYAEEAARQHEGAEGASTPALLTLVSLGPGDPQQMTLAAREALAAADVVIGYQTYIDQVRPLLTLQQEVIARPMQSELERAQQAIDLAAAGRRVALISSGDIGMYAMAGPVFELLHQQDAGQRPEVQVLPGVSAFQAAAARVGAAINHDLCTISLSDLLTPWELIEGRLWAAAEGDFVLALYNPRSKGRDWQLARACAIVRTRRPAATPVLLARNVTRPDEQIIRTTLADLDPAQADMLTVVLIGNSQSYWSGESLVTPRGYQHHPAPLTAAPAPLTAAPAPLIAAPTYPINLSELQGAPVVVVGGGLVGERKVRGLLAVGARVTLISPDATPQLRAWASGGAIHWEQRTYQSGDRQSGDLASRPALVFAATNDRPTNAQVAQDAAALGLLCNVADAPHEGSFHLPAVYREAGLVVAFSTDGASPGRARQVRDQVNSLLQQEGQADGG